MYFCKKNKNEETGHPSFHPTDAHAFPIESTIIQGTRGKR